MRRKCNGIFLKICRHILLQSFIADQISLIVIRCRGLTVRPAWLHNSWVYFLYGNTLQMDHHWTAAMMAKAVDITSLSRRDRFMKCSGPEVRLRVAYLSPRDIHSIRDPVEMSKDQHNSALAKGRDRSPQGVDNYNSVFLGKARRGT
jgi:hypothetical protein